MSSLKGSTNTGQVILAVDVPEGDEAVLAIAVVLTKDGNILNRVDAWGEDASINPIELVGLLDTAKTSAAMKYMGPPRDMNK